MASPENNSAETDMVHRDGVTPAKGAIRGFGLGTHLPGSHGLLMARHARESGVFTEGYTSRGLDRSVHHTKKISSDDGLSFLTMIFQL